MIRSRRNHGTDEDGDTPLAVADAFGELCGLFCDAALDVWQDLSDTRHCGSGLSEDSITDYLLLNMKRRSRNLVYYRHSRHEESHKSGADWLWLFVTGARGFPLLVQAKRLYDDLHYRALDHQPRKRRDQLNLLERNARRNGLYPLVCFYNSWPTSQPWAANRFAGEERLWGLAVARAADVKKMLRSGGDNSLSNIGPVSYPWHLLVCPHVTRSTSGNQRQLPDRVRDRVVQQFGGKGVPAVRENLPENLGALVLAQGLQVLDLDGELRGSLSGVVVIGEARRWD